MGVEGTARLSSREPMPHLQIKLIAVGRAIALDEVLQLRQIHRNHRKEVHLQLMYSSCKEFCVRAGRADLRGQLCAVSIAVAVLLDF